MPAGDPDHAVFDPNDSPKNQGISHWTYAYYLKTERWFRRRS